MPARFPSGSNTLATLRSLAARGDKSAEAVMAIMDGTKWPSMTAAAEDDNVITISGQVKDQDGQPVAGVHDIAIALYPGIGPSCDEVAFATSAALPACTPAGTGVGHTLTGDANGALSVDGVAVQAGDRILVKNQVAGDDNGIYVVTDAGSGGAPFVLTRATDFDSAGEMPRGACLRVRGGDRNPAKYFVHTTAGAITVDTTALTFLDVDQYLALALGDVGTLKAQGDAREMWIRTDSAGAFEIHAVGHASTLGDCLIDACVDAGETELFRITFA